jgi:hypothetical protein
MLYRIRGRIMIIYQHESDTDGLSVTVSADWSAGKFTVQFRDTDADAVIETRTYSNPESALWFARRLVPA